MIYEVNHRTHYRYAYSVVQSLHLVHMSPRNLPGQIVRNHSLLVDPAPVLRQESVDSFGNTAIQLDVETPHREFILLARSTIEKRAPGKIDFAASSAWDALDRKLNGEGGDRDLEALLYCCASRLTTATLDIADYAAPTFKKGRPVLDAAMHLTMRIYDDFIFDPHATDVSTPLSKVFRDKRGVCQDFAHAALACFRAFGVPARYVSGYLHTRPPLGRPKLQGADASHAWVSVWSPEYGWVDFDPTNGVLVRDEHVTVAVGRDYDDVSPISGVLRGGGEHTVSVGVDVNAVADLTAKAVSSL